MFRFASQQSEIVSKLLKKSEYQGTSLSTIILLKNEAVYTNNCFNLNCRTVSWLFQVVCIIKNNMLVSAMFAMMFFQNTVKNSVVEM